MWLNQQTIDGIRIMAALHARGDTPSRAVDLSAMTGLSTVHVQKIVHAMVNAGLIVSQRGRLGGIRLARTAQSISIADIVRAFEPADCPAGFMQVSVLPQALSGALFRAHRGFFQPLEAISLADVPFARA